MKRLRRLFEQLCQAIYPKDQYGRYLTQTLTGMKYIGGNPPKIFTPDQPEETTPKPSPELPPTPLKIYREE